MGFMANTKSKRPSGSRPVLIALTLYHVNFSLYIGALPIALFADGFSPAAAALIVGAFAGGLIAARLLFRRAFRLRDGTQLLKIAHSLQLVAALLILILPHNWFLVIPRAIHGLSCAFFSVALGLWVANDLPFERRGRFRGIEGGLLATILVLVPLLGIAVAERLSLQGVAMVGLLCAIGAFLFHFSSDHSADRNDVHVSAAPRNFFILLSILAFGGAIVGTIQVMFPVLITSKSGTTIASVLIVFGLASVIARVAAGLCSDRWGRHWPLTTGAILVVVGGLLFYFSDNAIQTLGAIGILASGVGAFATAAQILVADSAGGRIDGGRIISDASLFWDVGQFLGPLGMGLIASYAGASAVSIAIIGIGLITFALTIAGVVRHER